MNDEVFTTGARTKKNRRSRVKTTNASTAAYTLMVVAPSHLTMAMWSDRPMGARARAQALDGSDKRRERDCCLKPYKGDR